MLINCFRYYDSIDAIFLDMFNCSCYSTIIVVNILDFLSVDILGNVKYNFCFQIWCSNLFWSFDHLTRERTCCGIRLVYSRIPLSRELGFIESRIIWNWNALKFVVHLYQPSLCRTPDISSKFSLSLRVRDSGILLYVHLLALICFGCFWVHALSRSKQD